MDLLGRDEVQLDIDAIKDQITGKTILVTGAGGSIGSEICRQVIRFNPRKLLLLGHGENSIYLIDRELRNNYQENITEIVPIIADIQDRKKIFYNHGTLSTRNCLPCCGPQTCAIDGI